MYHRLLAPTLGLLLFLFASPDVSVQEFTQEADQVKNRKQLKSGIRSKSKARRGNQQQEPGLFDAQAIQQFNENHPRARFLGTPFYKRQDANDEVGTASTIYGTTLSTGATPIESAWNHINEVNQMLGDEIGGLIPNENDHGKVLQGVMYDDNTGDYKFYTLRFNQTFGGLPVFRGGVGFLVRNEANNPLVMSGFNVKEMAGFDVGTVGRNGAKVTGSMLKNVRQFMDGQPVERSVLKPAPRMDIVVSQEELVIFAGQYNVPADPQVAVSFIAQRGSVQTYPDYQKYLVVASASTGEILFKENLINNLVDVSGNVSGRATDGIATLECDPETAVGLPYAEVTISGGNSVFADANGNFTIPHGGSSQVTVTSTLRGQWFEVYDQSDGNSIPEISQQVLPPGPANFLHNPAPSQELPNANVNAYYESNVCRDYILSYEPTFPVIFNQQFFDVNTNIDSNCNAFYDGSSINFYTAGGGCNNTAFSDVVYHEYGHHLINVSGNGQGQMGEGTGDVVGVLMQDEPILAHGFSGNCGNGIRNANNTIQYPCSGGIHSCGQLLSGCVWDTRNELLLTEPSAYRDIGASLFFAMLIVRGQMQPGNSTIDPSITVMYLELDDDDGDVGNGTPHYQEIATGFGAHNMDAPPLQLLDFNYPTGRPSMINPGGGVAFTVEVQPLLENPQSGTGILYVDRGSGYESFPMSESTTNVYEANFPIAQCGSEISYYVSADTTLANTQYDPNSAPSVIYTAIVGGGSQNSFLDDFEADLGWTVSGDATDGQWERGVPAGGGDRGDPPTDGDGSGNCYVTDNADGNSDVDGGSTILTSPIMDATAGGGQEALLTYYRWYSNNVGSSPEMDIFVVDISNDGGSTWTNLETVGPSSIEVRGGWFFKSFRIADFITPTNQMRLRFTASDLGDGSVVEAGLDGVQIELITCDDQVLPGGYTVIIGSENAGGLTELLDSDDQYLVLDPTFLASRYQLQFIVDATAPTDSPSALQFNLEANTSNFVGNVVQRIELWNYNTSQYESLDTRDSPGSDLLTSVVPTGDPTRFVEAGTGAMRARVHYENGVPFWVFSTVNLFLPFQTNVDQIFWNVTP